MVSLADAYRARPYVLNRDTAPAFWMVATLWLPMATGAQTGNRFSFIEQVMPPGLGPPTHRHPEAEEGFYVLDGTCAFNALGTTIEAGPGTFVHLPRMTPHSFSVSSDEARVVNFYLPAGFELVVMSLATPTDERRRPSIDEAPPPSTPGQVEILSALFGQEEVLALPFAGPSTDELMITAPPAWTTAEPHTATAEAAPVFRAFGFDWHKLAGAADTTGAYDLFEVRASDARSSGELALAQDVAMYVIEGAIELAIDGAPRSIEAGSFAYLPANHRHAWTSGSAGARLLVFHLPGGFELALERYGGTETQPGDDDKVRAVLEAGGATF